MNNPYIGFAINSSTGEKKMGKGILRSKTFWFNLVGAIVNVAVWVQGSEFIAQYPEVVTAAGAIVTLGNIILRFRTKSPIKGLLKKED